MEPNTIQRSETGLQLLARLRCRILLNGLESHLFNEGPYKGNVYEFHGNEGCAKSEMCMNLVVKCILPTKWRGVHLNGRAAGVVYIDTEFKCSILRITTMLEKFLHEAIQEHKLKIQSASCDSYGINKYVDSTQTLATSKLDECETYSMNLDDDCLFSNINSEEIEVLINDCLGRLHIIQTASYFQLLMSLYSMEVLMSSNPDISLLILDSVSAYYWIQRSDMGGRYNSTQEQTKKLVSALSTLLENYGIVCVVTTAALFSNKRKDHKDTMLETKFVDDVDYLGASWMKYVKHRLLFSRCSMGERCEYKVTRCVNTHVFTVQDSGVKFNL